MFCNFCLSYFREYEHLLIYYLLILMINRYSGTFFCEIIISCMAWLYTIVPNPRSDNIVSHVRLDMLPHAYTTGSIMYYLEVTLSLHYVLQYWL